MPLPHDLRTQLLTSLAGGNLVTLTGAGLSKPAPSNLMLAAHVSQHCYQQHLAIEALPEALRWDIDALAGHFHNKENFQSYFINQLVPWGELAGRPNEGHAAIADFLLTGASAASLTANFDTLVEQWSERHKTDLRGALDGTEASQFSTAARPLLKFHGCMTRGRPNTLWTHAQLGEPEVQQRIESCRAWMSMNLPGKDLLIVGFWTDWGYLNEVLASLLEAQAPASVTVVDPQETGRLEEKAPGLWATLSGLPGFSHVQISSDEALSELRSAFSEMWIRRQNSRGCEIYADEIGGDAIEEAHLGCPDVGCLDLYDIRRDAEGVAYDRAARLATPDLSAGRVGYVRLRLKLAGAVEDGPYLSLNGRTIRVVNCSNLSISRMRERYNEAPTGQKADLVICAGAAGRGTTENIVRGGGSNSLIGATRGGEVTWATEEEAFAELGL